ncbi:NADH-quinone oxidoreductase subunit C [Streptomyces apocyni]|uniref:NADH-quinone oxidoreductase subunit C n=1 Tax=Streptomyces apocyni TaxID=2654677 RepID=UPI0012EA34E4|nr:NADH-quinone oxidoreductase subunit C [Streptomyces apocyni]
MTNWLPRPVTELFGEEATVEDAYDLLTVDVPAASWTEALLTARADLGCSFFDWLSAVDEPGTGFRVSAHVVALHPVRRLLLRTTVPHSAPVLASAVGVYAGAAWHERETHEMFGVDFTGHPGLTPLLLPDGFEGHPLRKDFVLAARVAKAWPGAKEPGESEHGGPKRRQMLPPGVPDPNDWGPQKGQLPPAPARPARGAARATPPGDRPARRTRTAGEGSASQTSGEAPRRTRTAAEGSASQADAPATPSLGTAPPEGAPGQATGAAPRAPRRTRSAAEGSASQSDAAKGDSEPQAAAASSEAEAEAGASAAPESRDASAPPAAESGDAPAPGATAEPAPPRAAPRRPRGSDAPWHHARPAFADQEDEAAPPAQADAAEAEATNDADVAPPDPAEPRTPRPPKASTDDETGTDEPGPDGPRPDNSAGGTPA